MHDNFGRRPRLSLSVAFLALVVSACGASDSVSAVGPGSGSATSAAPTVDSTPGDPGGASVGPLEQLVRVNAYGVGFGVPKEWLSVEAAELQDPASLRKAAHRWKIAPQRLVRMMSGNGAQTVSVSRHAPFDRVFTQTLPGGTPSDGQLTRRLTRQGIDLGPLRHSTTPAGEVTRIAYAAPHGRGESWGEFMFVDAEAGSILINVMSNNNVRPIEIGNEIWRTLQPL